MRNVLKKRFSIGLATKSVNKVFHELIETFEVQLAEKMTEKVMKKLPDAIRIEPKLDGISVIKQWRSEGRKFPVLILTARDRWQDKVEGLESGADDYVAKPFQIEEVMARANALIRRSAGFASPKMEFGCITIDTGAKRALLNNQALELTAYEYNALEYMAMRSGQVVSKTDLTEHLYDQDFDRDSNVIEVFIARLRKKIDPDNTLKPISTLRGRGYRFELGETQH